VIEKIREKFSAWFEAVERGRYPRRDALTVCAAQNSTLTLFGTAAKRGDLRASAHQNAVSPCDLLSQSRGIIVAGFSALLQRPGIYE